MLLVVLIVAGFGIALVMGFLVGMLTFKKAQEWCPEHGITRTCELCAVNARGRLVSSSGAKA